MAIVTTAQAASRCAPRRQSQTATRDDDAAGRPTARGDRADVEHVDQRRPSPRAT